RGANRCRGAGAGPRRRVPRPHRKGTPRLIWIVAANELRRRVRDRSMVISCLIAPLALAAILGFAFGHSAPKGNLTIGVSGASRALVVAAAHATQLPSNVVVRVIPGAKMLKGDVADGTLAGGVILTGDHRKLTDLLVPI